MTVHELDGPRRAPRRRGASTSTCRVRCSSGTYVRAIARDLGAALGVGGHLTALRRTAVGPFGLDDARTLDELGRASSRCCRSREAARASFPAVDLDEAQARATSGFGRQLDAGSTGSTAVFAPDGEFLALYEPQPRRPPGRRGVRA